MLLVVTFGFVTSGSHYAQCDVWGLLQVSIELAVLRQISTEEIGTEMEERTKERLIRVMSTKSGNSIQIPTERFPWDLNVRQSMP